MKKSSFICLSQMIILIALAILNIFVFNIKNVYIFSLTFFIFAVFSFFMLGYENNNYRNKRDIMQTIFMNIIIYLIITYLLGIVVGFSKNGYSVSFYMFFKNAIPYAVLILVREYIDI